MIIMIMMMMMIIITIIILIIIKFKLKRDTSLFWLLLNSTRNKVLCMYVCNTGLSAKILKVN